MCLADIILKVAGILTVKGGTGAIVEYLLVYLSVAAPHNHVTNENKVLTFIQWQWRG